MKVHPFRIKRLLESELSPPTPARLIGGDEAFTVERILDVRLRGSGWQYLVDW